jgi:hypothetical protein
MNTVQNGKGDNPRNNWGPEWYDGYDAIDWHRWPPNQKPPTSGTDENTNHNGGTVPAENIRQENESAPRRSQSALLA